MPTITIEPMVIAARPLKLGTSEKHVMTLSTFLSTRNGNRLWTKRACAEKRGGRIKETEKTTWDINSIEEGASMCTERSIDKLQQGMIEISFFRNICKKYSYNIILIKKKNFIWGRIQNLGTEVKHGKRI